MSMTDVARKLIAGRSKLQMCEANDMVPTRWCQSGVLNTTALRGQNLRERKAGQKGTSHLFLCTTALKKTFRPCKCANAVCTSARAIWKAFRLLKLSKSQGPSKLTVRSTKAPRQGENHRTNQEHRASLICTPSP